MELQGYSVLREALWNCDCVGIWLPQSLRNGRTGPPRARTLFYTLRRSGSPIVEGLHQDFRDCQKRAAGCVERSWDVCGVIPPSLVLYTPARQ